MTYRTPEIEKQLEKFLEDFVTTFETYITEYYKRLKEGVGKAGKSADMLRNILEIGKSGTEITEGVLKATSLIAICCLQLVVDAVGVQINREKVKKLNTKLEECHYNSSTIRHLLIQGGATIFEKYEPLFARVTTKDQSKSWRRGLEKVTQDAVNRTIDYLRENPLDDISPELITKGVICGKSKRYRNPYNFINIHKGRSIEISGLEIKTTLHLFEKVGLIDEKNNFHVKKSANGYGFRALFEWETNVPSTTYDITDPPSSFDYRFTLQEKVKEIADSVLEKLDLSENGDSKILKQAIEDAQKKADKLLDQMNKNHEVISKIYEEIKEQLVNIEKKVDNVDANVKSFDEVIRENLSKTDAILNLMEYFLPSYKQPVWFDVTEPTQSFTGRTDKLEWLCNFFQNPESNVVAVCGLGGVGKSELAKKYIKDYGKKNFNNVLWINSENDTSIIESFVRLAKDKLKISTLDGNGEEKDRKSVISDVIGYFKRQKNETGTLFVLDNANESVIQYLNQFNLMEQSESRVSILITSSYQEWDRWERNIEKLNVGDLSCIEAMELLRKELGMEEPVEDQEVTELAKVLQCFPLALQQAIAYIKDKGVTGKFTIGDYLEKFKKKTDKLLNPKFDGMGKDTKTTATVWKMTMDRIKSVTITGPLACEILNIMAFLAPENIKRDWFLKRIEDEKLLKRTVHLLVKYSMINEKDKQSNLSVHRLVQQVVQMELQIGGKTMEMFRKTYVLLERNNRVDVQTMKSIEKRRQLLPHFQSFYNYLERWIQNYPGDAERIELHFTEGLLWSMNESILGDPKLQCELLERLLKIMEKYNKKEYRAAILLDLGTSHIYLQNFEEAKKLLEEALEVFEKNGDKLLEAIGLTNLSYCYELLGNSIKAAELIKKSFIIQRSFLANYEDARNDDLLLHLSDTYVTFGLAYGNSRNLLYQEQLIEHALKIYKAVLKPNDVTLGSAFIKLSHVYSNQGRYTEQLECLTKAEEVYLSYYNDKDHPEMVTIYYNKGAAYNSLKKPLNGIKYFDHVNRIRNMQSKENLEMTSTAIQLGLTSVRMRRRQERTQEEIHRVHDTRGVQPIYKKLKSSKIDLKEGFFKSF